MARLDPSGLDRYYTPDALAHAIVERLDFLKPNPSSGGDLVILEPSCGHGAFTRALRYLAPKHTLLTCDLDPEVPDDARGDQHFEGDFLALAPELAASQIVDVVVGNPPFNAAREHVEAALSVVHHNPDGIVAMILPWAFLSCNAKGARDRGWWARYTPTAARMIHPRPRFHSGKADMREFGLYVWTPRGCLAANENPAIGFAGGWLAW